MLVLVAACGNGPLTLEEYAAVRIDVTCDYLVRCGVTPSIENCVATRGSVRFSTDLLAAVEAGRVRWNGDAAEDCLDRLEQVTCDRTSESYRHLGCEPLFAGTVGEGAACTMSVECISNECWIEGCTDACCTGYCAGETPPAIGRIGEVCRLSGCESGAFCENSVCVPLRAERETCTYESVGECAYGLTCVDEVCAAPVESGQPCSFGSTCRLLGESCTPQGICGPLGQNGDVCISSNHCASHYVCGVESRCVPAPRIGEPCDDFTSACFDAGAFCDVATKRCALPKLDGAACTFAHECESSNCIDGACATCTAN